MSTLNQNKPINIEAARVQKVIQENKVKLQLLAKLNCEFFAEIIKKEESDIISHFGPPIGKLVIKHANLEDKFNQLCLDDGGSKMINIDDPQQQAFISDEQRQIILDLRGTTNKLLRAFSKKENQLLLSDKAYKQASPDFIKFNETIENLELLYESYMTTPLEEVVSVKAQLKELESKVQTLSETRDSRRDQLDKYVEECNKSKEGRVTQTNILLEKRRTEQAEKDTHLNEIQEKGKRDEQDILEQHQRTMEQLKKEHTTLSNQLYGTKGKDGKSEKEKGVLIVNKEKEDDLLQKQYKKAFNEYQSNMEAYDKDVQNQTTDNQKH